MHAGAAFLIGDVCVQEKYHQTAEYLGQTKDVAGEKLGQTAEYLSQTKDVAGQKLGQASDYAKVLWRFTSTHQHIVHKSYACQ